MESGEKQFQRFMKLVYKLGDEMNESMVKGEGGQSRNCALFMF